MEISITALSDNEFDKNFSRLWNRTSPVISVADKWVLPQNKKFSI